MLQKVAANVDNVAADLCFRASEVRWLLMKIFFSIAATSAADLLLDENINNIAPESYAKRSFDRREIRTSSGARGTSLYIIGVLNTQRFGAFVLKNGDFCGMNGAYSMQKYLYYNHFCMVDFFEKSL